MFDQSEDLKDVRCVVVTNNNFAAASGGGVLLRTLFSEFDQTEILNIHYDEFPSGQMNSGPLRYRAMVQKWPVAWLELCFKFMSYFLRSALALRPVSRADLIHIYMSSVWPPHREIAGLCDRGLSPSVIYCWPGDQVTVRFVEALRKTFDARVILHFMDNHIDFELIKAVDKVVQPAFVADVHTLAKTASCLMAISNSMAYRFTSLFGRPFSVFNAPIDLAEFKVPENSGKLADFRLAYIGTLGGRQTESFLSVVTAIQGLWGDGLPISLDAYLGDDDLQRIQSRLSNVRGVKLFPHPTFRDMPALLSECDALLMVYDFSKSARDHFRFSFPAKAPLYMASKRPIFAVGPADIEPMAFLSRHDCACVCNSAEPHSIAGQLKHFTTHEDLRSSLVAKAFEVCESDHDRVEQSNRFKRAFN